MNAEATLETTCSSTGNTASIDDEGNDDPYCVWTCCLTRLERILGLGVIVQLDFESERLKSLLPCLKTKLSQQHVVDLQTNYALLTCHRNLDVVESDDAEPRYRFNLKDVQACVGPARDKIALEDCVSGAVSCCGPTSMLKLSSSAPAVQYTLLPHTGKPCPIRYDFVILFLNKQFKPGETTLPPVVKVSQSLRTPLQQSLAQARSGKDAAFYLCSRHIADSNVKVKVVYAEEQKEVNRFCDKIDLYERHQRLKCSLDLRSNCSLDPHAQSINGAPIICLHEGRRNLVGIYTTGDQVVTVYGICQLLAGGPVPLFAAMRHPSARTLSPFRWRPHILLHLDTCQTQKAFWLEMFHLLVVKEEGSALVNPGVGDTMDVTEASIDVLTEILKQFSGAKELKQVITESHVCEPREDISELEGCVRRVSKNLRFLMQHFLQVQPGKKIEEILESVFRCIKAMLYWRFQYPDAAECLLSSENEDYYTSKAAETYPDSQSIKECVKHIRQCQISKREIEIERLRRQVANLQKELNEKEQVLKQKKSEDSSVERRTVQLEEEKEITKLAHETMAAGNPRGQILIASPTIKMLTVLKASGGQKVEIVASIARKWKQVGIHLDFDATGEYLDTIETGNEKDPSSCCQAMFQYWLKGNGVEQTWGQLIEILKDCKLGTLAGDVEKVLMALEPLQ